MIARSHCLKDEIFVHPLVPSLHYCQHLLLLFWCVCVLWDQWMIFTPSPFSMGRADQIKWVDISSLSLWTKLVGVFCWHHPPSNHHHRRTLMNHDHAMAGLGMHRRSKQETAACLSWQRMHAWSLGKIHGHTPSTQQRSKPSFMAIWLGSRFVTRWSQRPVLSLFSANFQTHEWRYRPSRPSLRSPSSIPIVAINVRSVCLFISWMNDDERGRGLELLLLPAMQSCGSKRLLALLVSDFLFRVSICLVFTRNRPRPFSE
jgi:hypothetical protein